jgi:hypothetical protein
LVQFHGRCYAADGHIGPIIVVSPEPFCGVFLGLLYTFDDVLVKPFMPDGSVIALNVGILLGFARLDILNADMMFFCPSQQFTAYILRVIIDPNSRRLATPFDDIIQTSGYAFGR